MKKVSYFVLLTFLPLIGFSQVKFKNRISTDESSVERSSIKDLSKNDQADFKYVVPDSVPVNDTIRSSFMHYDIYIGTFIPTQKAELIGAKPLIGLSIGVNKNRMTYDLTLEIRFGKTNEEYQLANTKMTDHYLGGYAGIDIMGEISNAKKSQFLLFGGAGLDLFEIEPAEYRDPTFLEYLFLGNEMITTKRSRNIVSPNFNFGVIYRIYLNEESYLGIRYRYNFVDYNSKKILTDVTGNFHSITLSYGGFSKEE